MTKFTSLESYDKNNTTDKQPRYNLDNPPSIKEASFNIESGFLRHIKAGEIPNLHQYLEKLIAEDWTCLLAHNPRPEFFYYLAKLDKEILAKISWRYVLETIKSANNN